MIDILIGICITVLCFIIFIVMSNMVVGSHREAIKKRDVLAIKEAAVKLREYAVALKDDKVPQAESDKKLYKLATLKLEQSTQELEDAIEEENYERATELRDAIEIIKLELEQFSDEDQST